MLPNAHPFYALNVYDSVQVGFTVKQLSVIAVYEGIVLFQKLLYSNTTVQSQQHFDLMWTFVRLNNTIPLYAYEC